MEIRGTGFFRLVFIFGIGVGSLSSCQKKESSSVLENFVSIESYLPQEVGDQHQSFLVTTAKSIRHGKALDVLGVFPEELANPSSTSPRESSPALPTGVLAEDRDASEDLIVGFTQEQIQSRPLFGGVIVAVSDGESEDLGGLKLAASSPVIASFQLVDSEMLLKACRKDCSEASEEEILFRIPAVKDPSDSKRVYLNFSALGRELKILDEIGFGEGFDYLEPVDSSTVTFDYSQSTLVFDVKSKFLNKNSEQNQFLDITTRWYFKWNSEGSPYFQVRPQVDGVGFFTTDRALNSKITRFRSPSLTTGSIHYFVKNVPEAYRQAFAEAFEDWNSSTRGLFPVDFLSYEFMDDSDPRSKVLVAGDIRYNILEWDLKNRAGYGGLGPSVAHPATGEIFSAQTLIQGPAIEEIYKKWFLGVPPEPSPRRKSPEFSVKMGALETSIPSQDPRLHDPVDARSGFDDPPEGYTYETYMRGYFHDMVAHELGHNLGLRHNFKGSLAFSETSVSRSIMEYLGAMFRHLDRVGEYDVMAISYGYKGVLPTIKTWFCTDEDENDEPLSSAECSSNDATADPFGYFQSVLKRVMKKSVNAGVDLPPNWTSEDLETKLNDSVVGLARYANSAASTAGTWTNFFTLGRPTSKNDVPDYTIKALAGILCDEAWDLEAKSKTKEEDRRAALANLEEVRRVALGVLEFFDKPWPLASHPSFKACNP